MIDFEYGQKRTLTDSFWTAEPRSPLVGQQLRQSERLQKLVGELVSEVQGSSSKLNEISGAKPELAPLFEQAVAALQTQRGRELFYRFIGSGGGYGPFVELLDGSVKLDLINGIGIHIMGHSHPKVMAAALRGALSDVVMQGNLEPNREYSELSGRLVKLASKRSRLRHAWLATCGSMANENALKIARQKSSPARMIVSMQGAFAGRSTMMAEITDNPTFKVGLPEYHEVLRVPFYNSRDPRSTENSLRILQEHAAKHKNNICCFTFEPVQGEGGFNVAPTEFFKPLLEFCREQKIAVWADEVQTFSRTTEMFAFETLNIGDYIDICTIAKTAQNGATLYTTEFNPKPGLIAGTFSGSSSALAAGCAVLDVLTEEGYLGPEGHIQKIHREFVAMLNRLNETSCKNQLRDAGGLGLMVAVTPLDGGKDTVNKLLQVLFKNGLLAFSCGKDPVRIRFLLPAVLSSREIAMAEKVIAQSVAEVT